MKKIMFVCHGNICRSPMAEFIFKKMLAERGIEGSFEVSSCATSSEEIGFNGVGHPVYPPARRELQKHGIACDGHRAHQITQAEYDRCDRVYYMDRSNYRYLTRLLKDTKKCFPLLDRDVADPWYTGDFSQTWQDILEGCGKIMEEFA